MKITEENFVAQLQMRNQNALAYVIDHYAWILKTVIKKHLFYLPDLYEECMNDCLLAIWNNIGNYAPERNSFKNWVGGIAKYKSTPYAAKLPEKSGKASDAWEQVGEAFTIHLQQ
ncbi:MAG: hypothetical protein PHD36_06935 [Desulfotomaculaceae bacterium]|nr:hypothetical protein [Desulfotomaculaceae bacterium]